jgi:bis(5'-adenosyl)-triphosphatase
MKHFASFAIPERFVIFETAHSFVFTDYRPVAVGHVLVSPKRCAQFFGQLSAVEKEDLLKTALLTKEVMVKGLSKRSGSILLQDGPAAGQTVPHVHIHVFPRDWDNSEWANPQMAPDEARTEYSAEYRSWFADGTPETLH